MKDTTKGSWGAIGILITIIIIVLITGSMCSCTSKSGQDLSKPEKVVILDSQPYASTNATLYKVRILSKGVVCFIDLPYLYEVGDTVLYRFND